MATETIHEFIVDLDNLQSPNEHLKLEYLERLRREDLVVLRCPGDYFCVEVDEGEGGAS